MYMAHHGVGEQRALLTARLGSCPDAHERLERLGAELGEGEEEGHQPVQLSERYVEHLCLALHGVGEAFDEAKKMDEVRFHQQLQKKEKELGLTRNPDQRQLYIYI